ncbi:MAG: fibronectin type III domain-containing protein [Oscillospiraceae bacterium]|jgi:hypothetical protein|nr:fibronectin type III domain-containing protein [Oscillospiraceae bacterium]
MAQAKQKPPRGSSAKPDHILLSLNGDAATARAITWRTAPTAGPGFVEYWEACAAQPRRMTCQAQSAPFVSDIDESRIHWCHLRKLKPGTRYAYTCGDAEQRSAEYSFRTAPTKIERFKFICVADQQKGQPHDLPDYSGFNRFLKELLRRHPDTAFFLTGGDNTDCGQHEQQWNGAFLGLAGVAESVPFMMALGNHDNRGFRDYKNGVGRYYAEPADYFDTQLQGAYPDNGPANWKTENYAFAYGDAQFSVIGINGPEEVNDWLSGALDRSRAKWKLGVYHFPVCYSGTDCQNYDCIPALQEGMEKLDLLFSGHEHNFSRSFPRRGEELFDRPSQGTVHYMLGNSNQNPPGSRTVSKIWHAAFFPQEEQVSCACVVEVEGDTLTLTSVLDDGRIVDRCVINKAKDEITPCALAPRFNRTRMMFKGMDPGLSQADTPCEEREGVWFAPLGVLVGFIGGAVEKTPGRLRLEIYGHWAVFTQGAAAAQTDRGEVALPAAVYRAARGQLYVPAAACAIFEMRWGFARRNNFLSFEHESEDKPVTPQP